MHYARDDPIVLDVRYILILVLLSLGQRNQYDKHMGGMGGLEFAISPVNCDGFTI